MIESTKQMTEYDKASIKDNLRMVALIFFWMATLTVSDKAHLYGWWSAAWITWGSIAINAAVGLWLVQYYRNWLKRMDDLQRKIQLEALSMAFGVTLVACCSYMLMVTWGFILDEEVSDIFMVMMLSYSAALMLNVVRYRRKTD